MSIACLFIIPFIEKASIRTKIYRPIHRILFWIFAVNFIYLGFLGSQEATDTYITQVYFAHTFI